VSGITFLGSFDDRPEVLDGVYRAGGTDLQERLRTTGQTPHIYDLTAIEGFAGIDSTAEGTTIGAGTTVATVARELEHSYPALAKTARSLATPQVRAIGTIGGNLVQRTRCWYYRHPHTDCLKSGGSTCPARTGRHLYGVVFDVSECVHPHPSSIAMALLTYDAGVTLAGGGEMTVSELLGDGVDPTRDHQLPNGEIITSITLPPPLDGERAAYFRSISRFEAEWPLVEAVCRAQVDAAGRVTTCGLGLGGVATVPMRMKAAEEILLGSTLDPQTIAAAATSCTTTANPLRETGYKVPLVEATVREVLERIAGG
jgi:xanthine dehydrogenase YagS FAD-binding subunit